MSLSEETTLWDLLLKHDNNYGFDPRENKLIKNNFPLLSIIIPYYNTGDIFDQCIFYLRQAVRYYPGQVEVIVVDDGSNTTPLNEKVLKNFGRLLVHESNLGRTEARNTGLAAAKGEIIIFMDSDIMIDREQLWRHASLHFQAKENNVKSIVVSFFQFIDKSLRYDIPGFLIPENIQHNDYRISCTYGPTWIGCDEDRAYINEYMEIVNETNFFKDWRGKYKAWVLPNMILGGLFSVIKEEIVSIDGFDSRFKGYGFTETSAVTKMIALRSNMVIPSLSGGGIHIDDPVTNVPRDEKDRIFWERHDYYYNTFLNEKYKI